PDQRDTREDRIERPYPRQALVLDHRRADRGRCDAGHRAQPTVERFLRLLFLDGVAGHGIAEERQRHEHQDDEDEHDQPRNSKTLGSMSWLDDFRRSPKRGRIPVATKRPVSIPSASTPSRWNVNISWNMIVSPSIPAISLTLVTLRVPSVS